MFKKITGGKKVHVQGLEIWIPKKPPKDQIANHELPPKKQKWRRTPLPEGWDEKREEETYQQSVNPSHLDPVLEKFRVQEWTRRLNGYWFYNNGTPTYITGPNYYYLNWCKFDHPENGGYPLYYDFTRGIFYFRQYCSEDPVCLGYLVIGPRGTGKSSEEVALVLESMTRPPQRRQAAIQSKSEEDAKQKIFKEKMVEVYKTLPDFFKPVSNHGSNPEAKLSFFRDSVRGKKAKDVKYSDEEELANVIYPVPAKEKALDGGTYSEILNDEIGKTDPKKEANVYKRQQVNRFCVFRNNKKRGLIRSTTTVEEMDKGGAECRHIWDESDQGKRTGNGFTLSGLYRFFISAIDAGTQFADQYGHVDRVKAKKFHDIEREARKDDNQALSSYIRKNPYSAKEAFMVVAEFCAFNAMILNQRRTYLMIEKGVTNKGDLIRQNDDPNGKVIFIPNSVNGKFEFSFIPEPQNTNKVKEINSIKDNLGHTIRRYKPMDDERFVIGTDPIDHGKTVDENRKSKAAAYCFRKYDLLVDGNREERDWETHNFVAEYLHRPPDPEIFWNDMVMFCVFFGCQMLAENQKIGIINYFNQRGYDKFVMNRPENTYTTPGKSQDTPGAPSSKPMIVQYTHKLQTFVHNHGHRLKFCNLVDDLLIFDPEKPTKFDATVAAGFTLIGGEKAMPKKVETSGGAQYFQKFNNKGDLSVQVN